MLQETPPVPAPPILPPTIRSQDNYKMAMGKPEGPIHPVHSLPPLLYSVKSCKYSLTLPTDKLLPIPVDNDLSSRDNFVFR